MARRADYTGRKVNYITLLHFARPGGSGVGSYWRGRCDCGSVKDYLVRDVIHGRVKSCGKCEYHRGLLAKRRTPAPKESYFIRRRMGREIKIAVEEGAEFRLELHEFRRLVKSECRLCGSTEKLGVTRVDVSIPYTSENSIPICPDCRRSLAGIPLATRIGKWMTALDRLGLLNKNTRIEGEESL